MNNSKAERAAKIIWKCWKEGKTILYLPKDLRPLTRQQGYAIQGYYEAYSDKPIFGWKIAATSIAGQEHIGVSGPIAGRLLYEGVFKPDKVIRLGSNRILVAEPEFAFRIGKTLIPRVKNYSQDEIMSAVDALYLAIEIPDSRFEHFSQIGEEHLIADNACAHQFIIGPKFSEEWRIR